jgi:transposase
LTAGEAHDLTGLPVLLSAMNHPPRLLLADRSYDADPLRFDLLMRGTTPVIPSKANRREPWSHDADDYRLRNRIERRIGHLKQWRRVATRYDKTASSYLAAVQIAAIRMWLRFVQTT